MLLNRPQGSRYPRAKTNTSIFATPLSLFFGPRHGRKGSLGHKVQFRQNCTSGRQKPLKCFRLQVCPNRGTLQMILGHKATLIPIKDGPRFLGEILFLSLNGFHGWSSHTQKFRST